MSEDILSYDKIYKMFMKLREEESTFLRQKVKDMYCPDFECDIENFCVILPIKYKENFTEDQLFLHSNWLNFSEYSEEAYAFKNIPQHWSADAENIFS